MVASTEKQKLVYTLNRDSAANLTISSPLEAHKSHTLCFGIVALDMRCPLYSQPLLAFPSDLAPRCSATFSAQFVHRPLTRLYHLLLSSRYRSSFDNPVFASIELDYADVDADPTGNAANEATKTLVTYELDLGLNHVVRPTPSG